MGDGTDAGWAAAGAGGKAVSTWKPWKARLDPVAFDLVWLMLIPWAYSL